MHSGDLCNCESYSSLKCLLCISAVLECVERTSECFVVDIVEISGSVQKAT